jgi:prolyl 4-hydroxylase
VTAPARHYPLARDRRLFLVEAFLSAAQCERILEELEFAFWRPSTVAVRRRSGDLTIVRHATRKSESAGETWFTSPLRRMIRAIDLRVQEFVPRLPASREEWQATRYFKNGRFEYHLDCGHWAREPAGDRTHTAMIYLDTPRRGGNTRFRVLDVEVEPRPGRLVVWRNLTGENEPDPAMLHCSAPIEAGRKTVLVTWVRQRHVRKEG